ncbi:hypothetical protein [Priestia flexa]|uniref:hypothetical protein n=1 Tax=Priestia flexa TaxID=86664 RepID=UPI0004732ECB|nr:hypothetical protein [Priestia flexa]
MRRIYGFYEELLEKELMEYSLMKLELSNGDDKNAKRVIKTIQNYNRLIDEANRMKAEHGCIKW